MSTDPSVLTISRFINAPLALVWKAWSTPEHLAKWWIPAPIECKVVKLDLRPVRAYVHRPAYPQALVRRLLELTPARRRPGPRTAWSPMASTPA